MKRFGLLLLTLLAAPAAGRADSFDDYTNDVLVKAPKAVGVQPLKELTTALIADHAGVLKDSTGAFVVVKTNEGRYAKLLVQAAAQKVPGGKSLPVALVERF